MNCVICNHKTVSRTTCTGYINPVCILPIADVFIAYYMMDLIIILVQDMVCFGSIAS